MTVSGLSSRTLLWESGRNWQQNSYTGDISCATFQLLLSIHNPDPLTDEVCKASFWMIGCSAVEKGTTGSQLFCSWLRNDDWVYWGESLRETWTLQWQLYTRKMGIAVVAKCVESTDKKLKWFVWTQMIRLQLYWNYIFVRRLKLNQNKGTKNELHTQVISYPIYIRMGRVNVENTLNINDI